MLVVDKNCSSSRPSVAYRKLVVDKSLDILSVCQLSELPGYPHRSVWCQSSQAIHQTKKSHTKSPHKTTRLIWS